MIDSWLMALNCIAAGFLIGILCKELKQWHRLYAPELMQYRPIELSKFIQTKPLG